MSNARFINFSKFVQRKVVSFKTSRSLSYDWQFSVIALSASTSCSTPASRLKPGESSTSLNTSELNVSISAQNTLLAASSSHKKLCNKGGSFERTDPNFLDLCSESDHLWRRKQTTITNIGHVDSLGRWDITKYRMHPCIAAHCDHFVTENFWTL